MRGSDQSKDNAGCNDISFHSSSLFCSKQKPRANRGLRFLLCCVEVLKFFGRAALHKNLLRGFLEEILTQNQNWERQRPADHSNAKVERPSGPHFYALSLRLVADAPSSDFV
jgi:hypothetical protein